MAKRRGKLGNRESTGSGRAIPSALFWAGVAVVSVGPVGLILYGKSEAGWASLICGVILMVASRFSDIIELSIGPLKTKLVRQVEEAEQALEAVRALAAKTAETALSLVKMSGRFDGFTAQQEDEIFNSFRSLMDELGIEEAIRDEAEAFWHCTVEFDYGHFALGGNTIPEGASPEVSAEWSGLRGGGITQRPEPTVIEEFLRRTGYMNETSQEFLEDLKFYIANRQHRRPEIWVAQQEKNFNLRLRLEKQKGA